jgi:Flp pilus assembly protein TadB
MIFRSIDQVRRFFKILAGCTLLLVGVVMIFTPGPGSLVIFLGLTLLAAEFVWARRLMERMKQETNRLKDLKDSVWKIGRSDSVQKGRPSEAVRQVKSNQQTPGTRPPVGFFFLVHCKLSTTNCKL